MTTVHSTQNQDSKSLPAINPTFLLVMKHPQEYSFGSCVRKGTLRVSNLRQVTHLIAPSETLLPFHLHVRQPLSIVLRAGSKSMDIRNMDDYVKLP